MMFDRFADRSRAVLARAQDLARESRHTTVDTDHLVLALLDKPSVGRAMLRRLDVDFEAVLAHISLVTDIGVNESAGSLPFTPRTKKVFELALREMFQLGHCEIGPGHLVLGIIQLGSGTGFESLVTGGLARGSLYRAQKALLDELHGKPDLIKGAAPNLIEDIKPASFSFHERIPPGSFALSVNQVKKVESQTIDPATLERFARERRTNTLKIALSYVEGLRSRDDVKWPSADEVVATARTFEAYLSGGAS